MLSPTQLTSLRATKTRTLTDACTITRGGALLATTTCSVRPAPGTIAPVPADRLQPEPRWVVRPPYGTDVQRGDVLTALAQFYVVVEEDNPRSAAVDVRVLCVRQGAVSDDTGTPTVDEATDDVIHANAVVTLQRFSFDATTKHTRLQAAGEPFPARVDDLSSDMTDKGEGPSFVIQIACAGSVDIRDGDVVASIDPPLATLPSYAQVRHVEIKRVNAGLTYKVATVTELPQAGGTA